MHDKELSHEESLKLISSMIGQAKDAYHDTGIGAMLWGIVIAICSIVKFTEIHFDYRLPFDIFLLTIVAIIPQIIISAKEQRNRNRSVKTYDEVFLKYIWIGFGIAIFLLIFINNAVFQSWQPVAKEYTALTGNAPSFRFSEFVPAYFLLLYGLPTFITGTACHFKPMLWGGIFCWVCCLITLYSNTETDMLLTALSALVAWFFPGLLMKREYQKSKRKESADV